MNAIAFSKNRFQPQTTQPSSLTFEHMYVAAMLFKMFFNLMVFNATPSNLTAVVIKIVMLQFSFKKGSIN